MIVHATLLAVLGSGATGAPLQQQPTSPVIYDAKTLVQAKGGVLGQPYLLAAAAKKASNSASKRSTTSAKVQAKAPARDATQIKGANAKSSNNSIK